MPMPTTMRALVLSSALLPLGCAESRPQPAPPEATEAPAESGFALPDGFAEDLETYVGGWGRQWPTFRVHGTTAVFAHGDALHLQSWGDRDLAEQVAHADTDAYEIGTLSVHLTHAATLALVKRGTLSLDEPIHTHVPEFQLAKSITVEHLLTMTSGLPSFAETMLFERVYKHRPASAEAIVASFAGTPLEFEPGSDFAPSLSNAALLGLVLERVAGSPYPDVVHEHVLTPLGMAHTRFGRQPGASVGLSFHQDEHLEPVVEADPASLGAAGGWTSTAADLGKLYAAMLGEHFGPALSRRALGDNDLGRPYGFAVTTVAGRDAYGWVGRFDGHDHGVLLIPEDGLVVLHLANTEVAPGSDIAEAVAAMAYDLPVSTREEARPVPLDPAPLAAYAGRWVLRPSDLDRVLDAADEDTAASLRAVETAFAPGEGLRLHILGRPTKRMHPTGPRTFFFKDRPQSTARIATSAGATMLVLERGGGALHYRRAP